MSELSFDVWLRRCTALGISMLLIGAANVPAGLVRAAARGGPISVGGPSLGVPGTPITWNPAAMPIQYRVDPGPMAVALFTGSVVVDNATALGRIAAMFSTWTGAGGAALSASYGGTLIATGVYGGGPAIPVGSSNSTALANYSALLLSCQSGAQSPIIFDPQGTLFGALGMSSSVIGFAGICDVDTSSGYIQSAALVLNGSFQNGQYQITTDEFNQAITHEIGHFLGLDHSQINVDVLQQPLNCDPDEARGLPIMFPYLICQARVTAGYAPLSPDDQAWIARLYPDGSGAYGTISGTIYFSDGLTEAQGVNVIARSASDPSGTAFSAVSGYLFTGNPGQPVTCALGGTECNTGGSKTGSRDPRLVGTFDIPVLPGTYTISVEAVYPQFIGGSGVGPLRHPIPMPGSAPASATVSVSAGGSVMVNITLQGTPPRFDSFETTELRPPTLSLDSQRREVALLLRSR